MDAAKETWKVLPHDALVEVDDGILSVVGRIRMPLGWMPRRMTIVRLDDGRLVVFSAIALSEPDMARIEAFGEPAFLIVPNGHHRHDAAAWKARYPRLVVIAPRGACEAVGKIVAVDTSTPDLGAKVRFETVDGTKAREAALLIATANGTTLVVNDLIGNIRDASGIAGWMLRATGFAGPEPRIPKVAKLTLIDNENAVSDQLARWSQIDTLKRILVAHGEPILQPQRELRRLADILSPHAARAA